MLGYLKWYETSKKVIRHVCVCVRVRARVCVRVSEGGGG